MPRMNDLNEINKFRKRMGLEPIVEKQRKCLYCGKQFSSQGVGMRICSDCKNPRESQKEDRFDLPVAKLEESVYDSLKGEFDAKEERSLNHAMGGMDMDIKRLRLKQPKGVKK